MGHESVALIQVASERCSIACTGNSEQMCGGPDAVTVVVAKCPDGWTRFGGKCFQEITRDDIDWRDAMQTCSDVRISLFSLNKKFLLFLVFWWILMVSIFQGRGSFCV